MDYATLHDEIVTGSHPVTGAYSADDVTAAGQITDVNVAAEGGVLGMLEYLVKNRSRSNNGTDTTATAIVGRLQSVAEGAPNDDPFGSGTNITMGHIHAAKMFMMLLSSPQINTFDFINSEVVTMMDSLAGGGNGAKVWKPADVDALKALSQNQQSRAQQLGLGRVTADHVAFARTF